MGVALLSPLDSLGETDLLSAHMAQHLLIADLSAPLLVIGLRSPVYAFLLPRAMFAALARSQRLRALFRFLQAALGRRADLDPVLYGWHLAPAYEAALRSPGAARAPAPDASSSRRCCCGSRSWSRRAGACPGELWKIAHIVGSRFAGMFLGMAFVIVQRPIYEGFYGRGRSSTASRRPRTSRSPAA